MMSQADWFGAFACFLGRFLSDAACFSYEFVYPCVWKRPDLELLFDRLVPFFYLQFGGPLCGPRKALIAVMVLDGACGSGVGDLPKSTGVVCR
jgi:hypothetical protein